VQLSKGCDLFLGAEGHRDGLAFAGEAWDNSAAMLKEGQILALTPKLTCYRHFFRFFSSFHFKSLGLFQKKNWVRAIKTR
tara:strand:+ start:654 stop:893 length:240 start_codon:yes stop_codon:yes gene_type:complete